MSSSEIVLEAPSAFDLFKKYKREIGAIIGIAVFLAVWFMPAQAGLPPRGQQCLALGLFTVIWWAFSVIHPGFTAVILLLGWVVTKTAEPAVVFRLWSTPLVWLAIGGFLIAAGVEGSGLGKRIAYLFMQRFGKTYGMIIGSCFFLHIILSFLIPSPWGRSFIIMSVMAVVIRAAKLEVKHAISVGFAVFAASIPTSAITLTGDSSLNPFATGFAGVQMTWLEWLWQMGVPGLIACALTYGLHRLMFRGPDKIDVDPAQIRDELAKLGSMTRKEKATLFWMVVAIVLWVTDFIHHIHPGWIALGAGVAMALPRVGDVLTPADWNKVPLGTLLFMTAAFGIGFVGGDTGMSKWVAGIVLPNQVPGEILVFVLLVTTVSIGIHVCLGSVMATMGFVIPIMVTFTSASSINPLVPALLVYTAVNLHYIFPFHNIAILVGVGEQGKYGDAQVMKMGIPLTIIIYVMTVCVDLPWWHITGLLK